MRQSVVLLGASGTMGLVAFKELWTRRDRYDIVLLVRPSEKNKRLFKPYEKLAGAPSIAGAGISEGPGFKIVWGDATRYEDVSGVGVAPVIEFLGAGFDGSADANRVLISTGSSAMDPEDPNVTVVTPYVASPGSLKIVLPTSSMSVTVPQK